MKRFFSLSGPCLVLSAATLLVHAGGCGGSPSNPLADGGAGDDGGSTDVPHALGTIVLAESHAPSGGTSTPVVLASFVPDAAKQSKSCGTSISGCEFVSAPRCGSSGNVCGVHQACAWDDSCHATCTQACTAQCAADEECYFPSPNQSACRKQETFDAGALAFAGTTTPITLFPPYQYSMTSGGAPFLAGAQIEVQASGATGAGFDKFDEKFTATTFLQTNPPLDKIPTTTVFGSGPIPVGWAPGSDTIKIVVAGLGGVATCNAVDSSGSFQIPRAVVTAAMGPQGTSSLAISVVRERDDWRKSESTHGQMTTATVQPVGWLELTTESSESATFQGCATPGDTMCPDGCYDLKTDPYHCGSCSTVCGSNQACASGQCTTGTATDCTSCQTSADSGSCATYYQSCTANSDCSAYATCIGGCAAGDSTCRSNCQSQHSSGYSTYQSYASCICYTACPSECATQCSQAGL
jgi:hypothetical protein